MRRAQEILAAVSPDAFPDAAVAVGDALWNRDSAALTALADPYGERDLDGAVDLIRRGTERRNKLGHYSGAMFYYGGEWYWGADRFHHLEKRLIELGARRDAGTKLICPRPEVEAGPLTDQGTLTLEVYPSLRSPYTSIIFDRTVQLAQETGVTLVTRPVLPMGRRGVPATRQKGMDIFSDTAR